MKLRICLSATFLLAFFFLVVTPSSSAAPSLPPTVPIVLPTTTSTTTTSIVPIPPAARCAQWWQLATEVGFSESLLPTLDRIIYRESRCDPTQHNAADPNGGSNGLTQINRFWCLPSRYYPNGYLQTVGVLSSCDNLFDPAANLRAALALVAYSESVGLDSWAQWAWLYENPAEND
jgi:hypothetical protein